MSERRSKIMRAAVRWSLRALWLGCALVTCLILLQVIDGLTAEECRCFWEEHVVSLRATERSAALPGVGLLAAGFMIAATDRWPWRVLVAVSVALPVAMAWQVEQLLM